MSTTGKGGHASAGTCGIAVMAKASIPGRSKTRLVPPLTFTEACDFNTAFLRDVADNIAAAARQAPIQGYVAFGPPESAAFFSSTLAPSIGLIDAWHPNFGDCLFAAIRSALLALALVTCAAARADETPEERMQRRFPQPVKVGDLIGLPVYETMNRPSAMCGKSYARRPARFN